jgi:hypothetical protein
VVWLSKTKNQEVKRRRRSLHTWYRLLEATNAKSGEGVMRG